MSFATPSNVQGMAVTSRNVIWSRSYGRDNDSLIDVRRAGAPNGATVKAVVAPNMAEGIAIAGPTLHVVYESGSARVLGRRLPRQDRAPRAAGQARRSVTLRHDGG